MLKFQIPDVIWGVLFGVFVTIVICGATLKYIPSPQEMFGAPITDCGQSTIQTQKKATNGEKGARKNLPVFQNRKSDEQKNEPEGETHENECLIARYTGNLADFTRWLVSATMVLAGFGFWQVMVSRNTARRQLRAYVFPKTGQITNFNLINITYKYNTYKSSFS